MADQNIKNHARVFPAFHYGVFLPLLANFVWCVYRFRYGFHGEPVFELVIAVTLIVMALTLRVQVLTVQDRVIRLEMRLRLRGLLAADLADRAANLPVKQLVALRFACDEEVPELVQEILNGKLAAPKDIKLRIQRWEADHLRA